MKQFYIETHYCIHPVKITKRRKNLKYKYTIVNRNVSFKDLLPQTSKISLNVYKYYLFIFHPNVTDQKLSTNFCRVFCISDITRVVLSCNSVKHIVLNWLCIANKHFMTQDYNIQSWRIDSEVKRTILPLQKN